jgi:carboxyl-terminal processing protease
MKRRKFLPLITIAVLLGWQIKSFSQQNLSIEQAWKLVNDKYLDISFNGVSWPQVRERFRAKKYDSPLAINAAIRLMLKQLNDPAVRFLTKEQAAAFTLEVSGESHTGVGLSELLSVDIERSGKITIVTPIPETPAARAGLQPGDLIVSVDGFSTAKMFLAEVMERLRGQPKTLVKLTILRANQKFNITLQREIIKPNAVRSALKLVGGKKIGYIAFSQFTANSASEMQKAVNNLSKQGVDAFVLDLRNNPGGNVATGQKVAGMFLGAKPMATILGRGGKTTQMMTEGEKLTVKPLGVLVNNGTASMGEVVASALQNNQRAKIIGVKTFGKSLIQMFGNLDDKSVVVIPIGKIRTLRNQEILNNGITPDIIVDLRVSPILSPKKIVATSPQDTQFQKMIVSGLSLK